MTAARALTICTLLGLIVALGSGSAFAGPESPQDVVPLEVLGGTLGGAAFGVAGGAIAFVTCIGEAQGFEALGCAILAAFGYAIALPIGSTLGVNVAGSLAGVQGRVLLSALGAVLGEAAGLGIAALVINAFDDLPEPLGWGLFLGVVPLMSSVGAALGYNVGARVRPPGEAAEGPAPRAAYARLRP